MGYRYGISGVVIAPAVQALNDCPSIPSAVAGSQSDLLGSRCILHKQHFSLAEDETYYSYLKLLP